MLFLAYVYFFCSTADFIHSEVKNDLLVSSQMEFRNERLLTTYSILQECGPIVLTMTAPFRTQCRCYQAKVLRAVVAQDTSHLRPPCTQPLNSNRISSLVSIPINQFVKTQTSVANWMPSVNRRISFPSNGCQGAYFITNLIYIQSK